MISQKVRRVEFGIVLPTPMVPLCPKGIKPFQIGQDGNFLKMPSHPGYKKFNQLYRTIEEWCNAHPFEVVGKLQSKILRITYYSYVIMGQRKFNYSQTTSKRVPPPPIPDDAIIYPTFQEWEDAQQKRGPLIPP